LRPFISIGDPIGHSGSNDDYRCTIAIIVGSWWTVDGDGFFLKFFHFFSKTPLAMISSQKKWQLLQTIPQEEIVMNGWIDRWPDDLTTLQG